MKLEILQENLNHGLTIASRVISSKPQLAILSHILLEAKDGSLTLTASNQETTVVIRIGAKVTVPGQFTVPGRTLTEIVSSLSAEKISLDLADTMLTLKAGGFKSIINGTPAGQYPALVPKLGSEKPFLELPPSIFQNLIAKAVFAAALDESRAALTGVLFKFVGSGLILAATDGFRLSTLKLEKINRKEKDETSLIIPARALLEVTRVLSEEKGEKPEDNKTTKVTISILEETNQILFDLDDIKIYSKLIAGTFPDFEKIIPSNFDIKLTTTAEELTKTIRLASIFARESANIVKLNITSGKMVVSANAPQVGENESVVDVKTEGQSQDLTIAFNYRYFLDFLAAIGSVGEITIDFTSPTAPGVFRLASDPNFLHLIMPVRVQS